ncbi:hypothetical protein RJ640_018815 [Escallonia rubra]|uniref:Uncharacterized protein n=1 Tax=Escallonia rubra TaxID=112253 RepID=A0AA88RRN7_9ASTE|nr:hypothetical protein RJ640_018815 [Escallonia rubra]
MDTSSPCSDPNPLGSSSQWSNLSGTYSDEEVILASDRPKRRAGRKKFNETRHPVYRGAAEAFRPRGSGDVSRGAQRKESGKNSDEVSSSNETAEDVQSLPENVLYMDEEAMFDMPGLIASMAEGLLLSPPSCLDNGFGWEDGDNAAEVSLWSYSI